MQQTHPRSSNSHPNNYYARLAQSSPNTTAAPQRIAACRCDRFRRARVPRAAGPQRRPQAAVAAWRLIPEKLSRPPGSGRASYANSAPRRRAGRARRGLRGPAGRRPPPPRDPCTLEVTPTVVGGPPFRPPEPPIEETQLEKKCGITGAPT